MYRPFNASRISARTAAASVLVAATALVPPTNAAAAVVYHCVTDAPGLASVLAATSSDGNLDIVLLAAGVYAAPVGGFSATVQGANDGLLIVGGFQVDGNTCEAPPRSDPSLTRITGLGSNPGISITGNQGGSLIAVQNLSIVDAHRDQMASQSGGGLTIEVNSTFSGNILVERVIFARDVASGSGGALYIVTGTQTGLTTIRNNLMYANTALIGAAISFSGSVAEKDLIGNTIFENTATSLVAGAEGAIRRVGQNWQISDNIIWNNASGDQVDMTVLPFDTYADNDIQFLSGDPTIQPGTQNFSIDPGFVGASNFHLRPDSPLADAGLTTPTGGISSSDLDGVARVVGGKVDIGAYGHDVLRIEGLEP